MGRDPNHSDQPVAVRVVRVGVAPPVLLRRSCLDPLVVAHQRVNAASPRAIGAREGPRPLCPSFSNLMVVDVRRRAAVNQADATRGAGRTRGRRRRRPGVSTVARGRRGSRGRRTWACRRDRAVLWPGSTATSPPSLARTPRSSGKSPRRRRVEASARARPRAPARPTPAVLDVRCEGTSEQAGGQAVVLLADQRRPRCAVRSRGTGGAGRGGDGDGRSCRRPGQGAGPCRGTARRTRRVPARHSGRPGFRKPLSRAQKPPPGWSSVRSGGG